MNENPCSRGGVGLSHDVLDVFFHGLFSNLKCIGNFLVCPALGEMFHDCLLPVRELKFLFCLVCIELLASSQFF